MHKPKPYLILLAMFLSMPGFVFGQTRGYGEPEVKKPRASISSGYGSRAMRYRPSIYMTRGYTGYSLRGEQLRAEMSEKLRNHRTGLLETPLPSGDPVFSILNYRNALRVRSALAERSTALAGRQDYILLDGVWSGTTKNLDLPIARPSTLTIHDAIGERPLPKGEISYDVRPNLDGSMPMGSYNDALTARLEKRGQDYLRMGMTLYREKNYMQAAENFDMYRQTVSDSPRSFALQALCAYQQRDYNTVFLRLVRMLKQLEMKKATSLDDIWFEWQDLYEKRQDFTRLVDDATLVAKTPGTASRFGLIMAYFQWLGGDTNTAISAAEAAIEAMDKESPGEDETGGAAIDIDRTAYAKKFRDLLVESKSAPATSAPATTLPANPSAPGH